MWPECQVLGQAAEAPHAQIWSTKLDQFKSTAPGEKPKNLPLSPITENLLMVRQNDTPRQFEQEPMKNGQRVNTRGHVSTDIVQIPKPIFPRKPQLSSFGGAMFTSKSFSYDKPCTYMYNCSASGAAS